MLRIDNDGPAITGTNFFHSAHAKAGRVYLSTNAGAFRLLVPPAVEEIVSEMAAGKLAVVSRGPWPAMRLADAIEIMCDDGTDAPFAVHLDANSLDRLPLDTDQHRPLVLTVWVQPRRAGSRPHRALSLAAVYRRVESLPCMAPYVE